MRRATYTEGKNPGNGNISIHALREEGDSPASPMAARILYFYPRPPRGGRLVRTSTAVVADVFLSTPSVRRATARQRAGGILLVISIHALREEGDSARRAGMPPVNTISIHALREEGDFQSRPCSALICLFLSTPSARRATRRHWESSRYQRISIHALREEGDPVPQD